MNFDILTPKRIIFGCGEFNRLGELLDGFGKRIFVVCSPSAVLNGLFDRLNGQKHNSELRLYVIPKGEPSPESVDDAVMHAKAFAADAVLGMGGGSAIDTAKAVSGLVTNQGGVEDYLEGVGCGRVLINDPVSLIAVPTTSGTGAEATKNAVISSSKKQYKKSFRSDKLMPALALIDPELTESVPQKVTAFCGMDAITQLIESYTSTKSNMFIKRISLDAIKKIPSLLRAYEDPFDINARTDMAYCALMSGIALANGGLGAAHGFAAGIGACSNISHGEACAILLPHVMRLNLEVALDDYASIGEVLCGKRDSRMESALSAVTYIEEMNKRLSIPVDFKSYDILADAQTVAAASMGGSMNGNPVKMDIESGAIFLEDLFK